MTTATSITTRAVTGPIAHDGDITFEAAEALDRFDLVYISAAGKVSKHTGAALVTAIGIVDRAYALGDKEVSVLLLGRGRVLHMRAASAIAVGTAVMPVADGEVDDYAATVNTENVADAQRIGVAMTASGAANDVIKVICL